MAEMKTRCDIYDELNSKRPQNKIGIINNTIISNFNLYLKTKNMVSGSSGNTWRSGIKHDASKVMELKESNGTYINGF